MAALRDTSGESNPAGETQSESSSRNAHVRPYYEMEDSPDSDEPESVFGQPRSIGCSYVSAPEEEDRGSKRVSFRSPVATTFGPSPAEIEELNCSFTMDLGIS